MGRREGLGGTRVPPSRPLYKDDPDREGRQAITVCGIRFVSNPGAKTKSYESKTGLKLVHHFSMWGAEAVIQKSIVIGISPIHATAELALAEFYSRLSAIESRARELRSGYVGTSETETTGAPAAQGNKGQKEKART